MDTPINLRDPGTFEERACAGASVEEFFPDQTAIAECRQVIKFYCRNCPVMDACLDWTLAVEGPLSHGNRYGIFGGLTPRQREKEYYRRRKLAAA